jgi:hypothetical protein
MGSHGGGAAGGRIDEMSKSESAAAVAVTGLKVEREAPDRPVTENRDVSLCLFRAC